MAVNALANWLICYDITDSRRLARLHRFLCKQAIPVQYSVFHYEGSPAQMGRLIVDIEKRIDPDTDDVRAYRLPANLQLHTLGRSALPEDTGLLSSTSPVLEKLLRPGSDTKR